jgi:uncharacterized coiled-coil protein SlyX
MKEQLEKRLAALEAQFEHGMKVLRDLEAQEITLKETLLRISGAIEVLREELNSADQPAADGVRNDAAAAPPYADGSEPDATLLTSSATNN